MVASAPKRVPIARVSRIAPAEFEAEYLAKNEPVVISGLLEGSELMAEWTFEWFRERYAERAIIVTKTALRRSEGEVPARELSLGAYLDELAKDASSPWYMGESKLLEEIEALDRAVPRLPYSPEGRGIERRLWIGPSGTVTHFHKDNHFDFARIESFFMGVRGRKWFGLVSPADDAGMYPSENAGTMEENYAFQSPVDCEQPDLTKYPRFAEVTLRETIVEPGDVLFIPAGWWHYVRSLTPCVSVSNWWMEAKISDVVSRLVASEDPGAFLEEHAGTLTADDVRAFHGGTRALTDAWNRLEEHEREAVLALFDDEARALVTTTTAS